MGLNCQVFFDTFILSENCFDYLNICIRTIPETVPLGYKYFNRYNWQSAVVVVVVEISAPKVYPRGTLASASTL